jgi:hypothetical protein
LPREHVPPKLGFRRKRRRNTPGISAAYAAAIAKPNLIADESKLGITVAADPDAGTLSISDNGIGMSRDEMITQGTADLGLIPLVDGGAPAATETSPTVGKLIDSLKQILGARSRTFVRPIA